MGDRGGRDGHHGLARAHLGVDDAGWIVFIEEQRGHGLHHFALGREGRPGEGVHHRLPPFIWYSGINGRVLSAHGFEQARAER